MKLWLILTFPLIWLGVGRRFPFALLGERGLVAGQALWWVISLAWLYGIWRAPKREVRLGVWVARWAPEFVAVGLILLPVMDVLSWIQFAKLGYPFPKLLLATDIAILATYLGLRAKLWASLERLVIFAVAVSLVHLAGSILEFPLVHDRSDMLPFMMRALDSYFNGRPAYGISGSELTRIPYPPLIWLSYAPAYLLSVDPRWMDVIWRGLLGFFCVRRARGSGASTRIFAALWFLNPYLAFRHELYLDFFWLLLFLAFDFAWEKRWGLAAIAAGLLGATLQWGWLFLPFILMTAAAPKQWKKLVAASALAIAVTGAIFGYFYWREGDLFLGGLTQLLRPKEGTSTLFTELCLGLAWPFLKSGMLAFLVWAQRLILLGGGAYTLFKWIRGDADVEFVLRATFITLVLFIMFGPLLENYYYLAPLLLAPWMGELNSRTASPVPQSPSTM